MPKETKLYDLLDLSPSASPDEIKKAFRKKSLKSHPDKGGDPEDYKKINGAYEILSDPEKRKLYDECCYWNVLVVQLYSTEINNPQSTKVIRNCLCCMKTINM
jgi:DnaJ-class molecular chaperone